ncbi:MAG: sugar phosphate isomerase/epimerase family protein [Verrucomicrobiota bacterium]|nr:sugar phosphate isomerase/epimerase family protein [Verrucomicrobiota bacterium]
MYLPPTRRHFLKSSAALACGALLTRDLRATQQGSYPLEGRLYKTLKINMIKIDGSLSERFRAAKKAGFMGVEMNSPGMDVEETRQAIYESGLPVDGTVCSTHWKIRHSSPDRSTRAQALQDLKTAIRDTHAVGGHTVLLVVGKGEDGPESEIWPRSVENIRKAIPLAAELGISIVIENVWNQFLYDHEGDSNQTAERFVKYVDEFESPWVGMQFDIGNHWKYGSMGDWIRMLGKRVIKLDVKGFSRAENKFMQIGEGDIDFLDVRKALHEINYHGWVAAEVKGGDLPELKKISGQMDRAFGL